MKEDLSLYGNVCLLQDSRYCNLLIQELGAQLCQHRLQRRQCKTTVDIGDRISLWSQELTYSPQDYRAVAKQPHFDSSQPSVVHPFP
jgi:hypothetical protein